MCEKWMWHWYEEKWSFSLFIHVMLLFFDNFSIFFHFLFTFFCYASEVKSFSSIFFFLLEPILQYACKSFISLPILFSNVPWKMCGIILFIMLWFMLAHSLYSKENTSALIKVLFYGNYIHFIKSSSIRIVMKHI